MHKFAITRAVLLGIPLVLTGILISQVSADSGSPWLDNDIGIQNDGELQSSAFIPISINGNRDCVNHKFNTRPLRPLQAELSYTACAVQTSYGLVDPNGWLEFNSTGTAGKLVNYSGYSPGSIPVPSSKLLINYFSTGVGAQLYFNQNLPLAILATTASNGEVTYKINSPAQISLRDKANSLLLTQLDTIGFSGNGKWMVVDAKNRAVLRVNLETFEVLPFAPSFNYSIGLDPSAKTAITSDGKYAVVYSKNFSTFKIYDLDTCAPVPNSINAPVACQSKDLLPSAQQQITGLQTISRIRFIDNENLVFYASYQPTGQAVKLAKFRLSAGTPNISNLELLALGDSYISGEGVFEYKTGTDIADNKCHLSMLSHPFIVAEKAGINTYQSVACSGAKMLHITDIKIPDKDATEAQAKGKDMLDYNDEIFNDFLPGYRAQLSFVTKYKPQNILVTIGGNDIGFSNILKRCLSFDTCYSTYEERLELVKEVNSIMPELVQTYSKIRQESALDSKIYAIGYPQIAQPGGNCALNVHLNAEELEFSKLIIKYLDEVIEIAAANAGIGYVDTQQSLDGYKLCESKSSEVAVNGLTAGNDTPSFLSGPIGNESYHPNKFGHQLMAEAVLAGTENLGKAMPSTVDSGTLPSESGLDILDVPVSNKSTNRTMSNNSLTTDMVYRELLTDINLDGLAHSLKPSSLFNIVINSDPVNLGTFTSNASGGLSAQIKIPESIPTGFHTLHIYGQNIAGENIDIYKTVYVAANELDYDDDELLNSTDSCPTFENSGTDDDKDGTDDSCDGYIAEPLPTTTPPVVDGPVDEQPGDDKPTVGSAVAKGTSNNGSGFSNTTVFALQPTSVVSHNQSGKPDLVSQERVLGARTKIEIEPTLNSAQPTDIRDKGISLFHIPELGENEPKIAFVFLASLLSFGVVYFRRLLNDAI